MLSDNQSDGDPGTKEKSDNAADNLSTDISHIKILPPALLTKAKVI